MRQLFSARIGLVVVAAVAAQVAGPSFGAVVDKDPFKASPGWKPPVLVSQDHAHRETSLVITEGSRPPDRLRSVRCPQHLVQAVLLPP